MKKKLIKKTIVLDNDSNDNGNVFKSFIALSRSCAKLTFPLSAC